MRIIFFCIALWATSAGADASHGQRVFADETMTRGALALCVDAANNVYAVETSPLGDYRIVRLRDRDKDGVADFQTVFADGIKDSLGNEEFYLHAGDHEVLVSGGDTVWRCVDIDEDGLAEKRVEFRKTSGERNADVVMGADASVYLIEGGNLLRKPAGSHGEWAPFHQVLLPQGRDLALGPTGDLFALMSVEQSTLLVRVVGGTWEQLHSFDGQYSGLTVDPVTGFFLLCERKGSGGVLQFAVGEKGIEERAVIARGLKGIDQAIGNQGEIYVACRDRIVVLDSRREPGNTGEILQKGFRYVEVLDLIQFLKHEDMRVRFGAQFELARRGARAGGALNRAAKDGGPIERRHATWALEQIEIAR